MSSSMLFAFNLIKPFSQQIMEKFHGSDSSSFDSDSLCRSLFALCTLIFLCGNYNKDYTDALQDVAARLGLSQGSLKHYGLDSDVNGITMMAGIFLYGSSQDVQGFPPLLTRAMSFEIPIIVPDYHVIQKYVVDGVHGIIFSKNDPEALGYAFSRLISDGKLFRVVEFVGSSGRLIAKNMFVAECIFVIIFLLFQLSFGYHC
ncbi:hypothetical protein OROMI_005917 [Orobanche minor]